MLRIRLQFLVALKQVHAYSVTAGLALHFHPDDTLNALVKRNAKRSGHLALRVLKEQPEDYSDVLYLSLALENGIDHHVFSPDEINQLLNILSPFENGSKIFLARKNYQRDKVQVQGAYSYGTKFNGLYQELAYLYAAAGKTRTGASMYMIHCFGIPKTSTRMIIRRILTMQQILQLHFI